MYSIIAWLFYSLAVFALLILRITDPFCTRPFRVWIIIPIVFCLVSTGLLVLSIWESPIQTISAIVFLASGFPVYYFGFEYLDAKIDLLVSRALSSHYESLMDEFELELNEVE